MLTLIFGLVNLLNAGFYFCKLTRVPSKEIGTVKFLISQGLILMLFFNLPYKHFYEESLPIVDTFVNSLTETYMLFLNLVLSHGMYASPEETTPSQFYLPKILVSAAVFVCLWAWSYADAKEFEEFVKRDFLVDDAAYNWERTCFTFFLIPMVCYALLATWYGFNALTAKNKAHSNSWGRFRNHAGVLVLIMSGCNVSLVVFPFSSQVLQFVNENGVVNIYMLVLCYMFSPNTELDEEIIVDDDGNVSISQNDNRTESSESNSKEEEVDGDEKGI
mmetsp:Transcript_7381/g.10471  ORF Transcript_7381/g.10471 Transcript_7381/m.10471 type:complete len:275 (-) Transcript_7381:96-920(-)